MTTERLTVILTHEHTDFDALASMLGAHKLFPAAIPVLPRSLNRNLRDFLALYRSSLPFRQVDDLPRQAIERAIIVDAQAAVTLRGMRPTTPALIIDHHVPQRELPAGWEFWGGDAGANTTLLVERMVERGLTVNQVEATLLLLGIYEDTGSLIYLTTTPRDLRASAWLLEQGANLQVLRRFLYHPLSAAQTDLYNRLAEGAKVHNIAGHAVLVAAARAPEFNDEISTLAHALRDAYEAEGLFLLVELGDRIQVVARSSNNAIDVGRITHALGGGGHARAAAALIRHRDLDAVQAQLLAVLQAEVKPSVTVAQIMTHGLPVAVSPNTPIGEMVDIMQRHGFEGYPVIAGAGSGELAAELYAATQLVGLITRRQIDRALHHGLASHTVDRYMRSGSVTVLSTASIAELQRLMIASDWGQIPVIDPISQEIVGIVTRTDLIKLWGTSASDLRRENTQLLLQAELPATLLDTLRLAGNVAATLHFPLYAVGGFARDLLLGRPNFDVDLVVEGNAIKLATQLAQAHGGRIRTHQRFGTAKWILPNADPAQPELALDFVTARTEFYAAPTVLPTVERGSIKRDLFRRDFTINTLAINLTEGHWGELLDFYDGQRDLEAGLIRVLHTHSFVDDPTRILRAARFEQRFGFQIEARTLELIGNAVDLLGRVTPARVRHELELIFKETQPELALRRLEQLGALACIHPALTVDDWVMSRFDSLRLAIGERAASLPADLDQLYFAIWTYALNPQAFAELNQRLSLMHSTLALLENLHKIKPDAVRLAQPDLLPSEIYRILAPASDATRFLLPIITASPTVQAHVERFERELVQTRTISTGRDLKRLGLPPGPLYGEILEAARAAWMDGRIHTEADERSLIHTLVEYHRTEHRDEKSSL